jgi:hypothetical protein
MRGRMSCKVRLAACGLDRIYIRDAFVLGIVDTATILLTLQFIIYINDKTKINVGGKAR